VLSDGVRSCDGADGGGGAGDLRLKSFDGVPLEVYVILPPAPSTGTDGRYPLIIQSHGWGSSAGGPDSRQYFGPTADAWARRRFAVLQLTARGFADSCGSMAARLAAPAACTYG
jgi:predicted dienelactone hydrolase